MNAQPVVFDFDQDPPTREQIRAAASVAERNDWIVTAVGFGWAAVFFLAGIYLLRTPLGNWSVSVAFAVAALTDAAVLAYLNRFLDFRPEWFAVLGNNSHELTLEEMALLPSPKNLPENVKRYMQAIAAQGRHPVQMEANKYREVCREFALLESPFVANNGFTA